MKRHLLTALLALVLGVLGFAVSGVALAGNGNGNGGLPPGGDNPCQPGYHGVYDQDHNLVGCEHNGDGGGNCGQNQSGDDGTGGNGGDHGYGHEGDCTTTTETSTTETTTTDTSTTETTTTETSTTETTPTEPTTTETTPKPPGGPACPDGGPNNSGKDGQPGNDACARTTTPSETTPSETTPTETTPSETTPTETTPAATTPEQPASPPSIVGQPPKQQVKAAKAHQSKAQSSVAGTSAKSQPRPTHQPQPAPFTL